MRRRTCLVLVMLLLSSLGLMGEAVSKQEMQEQRQWTKDWLTGPKGVPFSFKYQEKSSSELLKTWRRTESSRKLDATRTERTTQWTDVNTGLELRCVEVEYLDFPVVEWTLHFKNTGSTDSPILADIQALDLLLPGSTNEEFNLHYIGGDGEAEGAGYIPHEKSLTPDSETKFVPVGGRPTNGSFPFYNLDWNHQGRIIVVGWSGQWASSFVRDRAGNLQIKAGQELTHLRLHPGEEIRSPMIVQMFWHGGDWIRAQNLWRHWMRAHNMPKPGGKDLAPILAAGSAGFNGPNYSIELDNEKDQELLIRRYAEEKLGLNYWWMDIYNSSTNFWLKDDKYGSYGHNGLYLARAWDADRTQYPNGLRAVSDYAHSKGMGLIVWYEPEEVWPGYDLVKEHPDWLLSAPDDQAIRNAINQGIPLEGRMLLNLGNPDALKWLGNHISENISKEGISVYRQDFNIEPLVFWRANDAADRQGITENLYVQSYLRFWDKLLREHPDMLIDSCASGGRRNDIETLRRSVPLWRSDDTGNPLTEQTHTYGLSLWVPYSGAGIARTDTYAYRSALSSSLVAAWDPRDKKLDYDRLRQITAEFWRAAAYYVEDYYPLTEFSSAPNSWIAWQFNRPEKGDGMVQAFRRAASEESTKTLPLRGLDPKGHYELNNLDGKAPQRFSGAELMQRGAPVEIAGKDGAAVVVYRKVHD